MEILCIIMIMAWAVGACLSWAAFMLYITDGDKRGARNLLAVSGVIFSLIVIVALIWGLY